VSFGGIAAASFTFVSDTSISAVVATGTTSGPISVTTPGGTATTHGWFTNATPITDVWFNFSPSMPQSVGTPIPLTVVSTTGGSATPDYKFFVEYQASTGMGTTTIIQDYSPATSCTWTPMVAGFYMVVVEAREHLAPAPYAAICKLLFIVTDSPTITSFTPSSGLAYSTVTITGTKFNMVKGVRFNGIPAIFIPVNATTITARAPASGLITVDIFGGGAATSTESFTITPPPPPTPTITSFMTIPGSGFDTVVISGTNFNRVSSVRFNGNAAFSFILWDSTKISAKVGLSSTYSGPITVTTPGGTATSATPFTP